MDDHDIIDISLHVIKRCGMYSKEYKNWITCENETLPIVEVINSFKEYWSAAITLVNQTAIPATNHGYGMTIMNDDTSIASYGESLANFVAAYAATQESMKKQATTIAATRYAGPARKHPAILHSCQPATPAHHIHPSTAIAAQKLP